MPEAPRIETDRLVLRMPVRTDFDAYAPTLMSERARHIGGPFTLEDAWKDFCAEVAGWTLSGAGSWAVELKETGAFCGLVGFSIRPDFPERELGWVLVPEAEGRGIAAEAAAAARALALVDWGWPTLVSYIDHDNVRSRTLAERLGARLDPAATPPGPCLVYRHPGPGPTPAAAPDRTAAPKAAATETKP